MRLKGLQAGGPPAAQVEGGRGATPAVGWGALKNAFPDSGLDHTHTHTHQTLPPRVIVHPLAGGAK